MKATLLILLLIAIGAFAQSYTEIPRDEYSDDDLIEPLRDYSIKYVLNQAFEDKVISNKDFQLKKTNFIYTRVSRFNLDYKFDLTLKNSRNDILDIVVEVRYQIRTGARSILDFDYDYQPNRGNGGQGSGNGGNGGNGGQGGQGGGNGGNGGSAGQNGQNGGSNGNDGYVTIPKSQYNSTLIKELVNFGKDFVVRRAIRDDALPSGNYVVKSISSAQKQTGKDGANYKFGIVFERSSGSRRRRAQANFTINLNAGTKAKTVLDFKYAVLPL